MQARRSFGTFVLAVVLGGTVGCASAGAQLKAKYPVGYKRLATAVPDCAEPSPELFPHCEVAAEILQSKPQKAVELLLGHLEKVGAQLAKAGDGERKALVSQVERTIVPALKQTLNNVGDTYSKAVLTAMDAIDLGSEKAVELLRTGISTAQKAAALLD